MFGRKKSSLLGIDISSSVVKVLEFSRRGAKYSVDSYAVEPLPLNAVIENHIQDEEKVAAAIRRAVKRSGSKTKDAAVTVPANATITKIVTFSSTLSEREIEDQIIADVEDYIAFPANEVQLDFEVLGKSESEADVMDVLLAASRREHVDVRTDVLERAGLKAKIVDVEAYTMENAFFLISQQMPHHGQGFTVAVVDIGATVTTLYVLVDGKVVFTREQSFGGQMLTEDIERYYEISYQDAGLGKKENNLPDDYEQKILGPFKRSMTTTVTRALQFFFSATTEYHTIDHIVLSGGCASIDGCDAMIEQETGTPTSIANPFSDMAMGAKVNIQNLTNDAPAMLIACGLALRSFD